MRITQRLLIFQHNQEFQRTRLLQLLHIYDNNLEKLALQDLQFLRILNAQKYLIISVEFEQLPSLEKSYFDKNRLTIILILPSRLNTLLISNQNINKFQFPDESFQLAALTLIDLTFENSMFLGSLQNFEYLNLKNNKIKQKNLIYLIKFIQLRYIEDSISNLPNIKEIDLRGNPIIQVYKSRDRIVLLFFILQTVLANERQNLINLGRQKFLKRNQSLKGKKQTIQKSTIRGVKHKIYLMKNNDHIINQAYLQLLIQLYKLFENK